MKRKIDVEELIRLGVPRFFADAIKKLEKRGLAGKKPSKELMAEVVRVCEEALQSLCKHRGQKGSKYCDLCGKQLVSSCGRESCHY